MHLYEQTTQTMLDIVWAARIGQLHPALINTNKLQQIIRQIADLYPNYEFSIPIIHARADKLTDVAPTRLAIKIQVPMLDKFATVLYKIRPVPIPQNLEEHISVYIKPQTPYISLNHDKRAYRLSSERSQEKCKHTQYHTICTHNEPIHEADGEMACEYLLVNQLSLNTIQKCNITFHRDIFHTGFISILSMMVIFCTRPNHITNNLLTRTTLHRTY